VGFQATGTRGRTILSGAESVKMFGQQIRIRARVESIEHLSAHADYGEILGWLRQFHQPPQQTFLVHGEPHATESLQEKITQQLNWKTRIPSYLEKVTL
jgi:metallo-beta-lactamase family protein